MNIVKTRYLSDGRLKELRDLMLAVRNEDLSRYDAGEDADLYYFLYDDSLAAVLMLYEMGETRGGRDIVEIMAFTVPDRRREGYAKALLREVYSDLRALPEIPLIRAAVYEDPISVAVLKKLHAVKDHDELLMSLDTEDWDASGSILTDEPVEIRVSPEPGVSPGGPARDEIREAGIGDGHGSRVGAHTSARPVIHPPTGCPEVGVSSLRSGCVFGDAHPLPGCPEVGVSFPTRIPAHPPCAGNLTRSPGTYPDTPAPREPVLVGEARSAASECGMRICGRTASIYGVRTYDSYLGRGHAARLMRNVLGFLKDRGVDTVLLEVSDANIPALGLYRSLGFKIRERLSYYYLDDDEDRED